MSFVGLALAALGSVLVACATKREESAVATPSASKGVVMSARYFYHFEEIPTLVRTTDLIVEGTVREVRPGRSVGEGDHPLQFREVRIEVSNVYYSRDREQPTEVVIEEEGWDVDRPIISFNGLAASQVGDVGFYFLKRKDPTPYYALINNQGRYLMRGDGLEGADRQDPLIERIERMSPRQFREEIAAAANSGS